MPELINFQDHTSFGTFSQIKFGFGKKILISFDERKWEIAIFKLDFTGSIPTGTIWKYDLMDFVESVGLREEYKDMSPLGVAAQVVLSCSSISEIPEKMDKLKLPDNYKPEKEISSDSPDDRSDSDIKKPWRDPFNPDDTE